MTFSSRVIRCFGSLTCAGLLIIACGGSDASSSGNSGACIEGETQTCNCADGAMGAMACTDGQFGECTCTAASACGNGTLDPGEMCDGLNLNNENCQTVTMGVRPGGALSCSPSCTFVDTGCTSAMSSGGSGNTGGGSSFGGTSSSGGMFGGGGLGP